MTCSVPDGCPTPLRCADRVACLGPLPGPTLAWQATEVAIAHARDAEHANEQVRASAAYRKICDDHPSSTWERRHVGTEWDPRCGFWMVRFAVRRRT